MGVKETRIIVGVPKSWHPRNVIANEVKQSQEIATLARRSASARRHVPSLLAMTTFAGRSL
jgi:hypothetical protein